MKFDEETQKQLDGKDEAAILMLIQGIEKCEEAKTLSKAAAELEADGKEMLMPAMTVLDLRTVKAPGIGTVTFTPQKRSTGFSQKKMAEYLLSHGVGADVIKAATDHATSESFKDSVMFKAA